MPDDGEGRVTTSGKVFSSTWLREHWVEIAAAIGGLLVTLYLFRKSSSGGAVPAVTPVAQPAAPSSSTTSVTTGGGSTGTLSGGIIDRSVIDAIDAQIAALQAQLTQVQLAQSADHAGLGIVASQAFHIEQQIAWLQQQRQQHEPPRFLGPPTPVPQPIGPGSPGPIAPPAVVGGSTVPLTWFQQWLQTLGWKNWQVRLITPPFVSQAPSGPKVAPPPLPVPPAVTPLTANPAPNPSRPSAADITHWSRTIPPPSTKVVGPVPRPTYKGRPRPIGPPIKGAS